MSARKLLALVFVLSLAIQAIPAGKNAGDCRHQRMACAVEQSSSDHCAKDAGHEGVSTRTSSSHAVNCRAEQSKGSCCCIAPSSPIATVDKLALAPLTLQFGIIPAPVHVTVAAVFRPVTVHRTSIYLPNGPPASTEQDRAPPAIG